MEVKQNDPCLNVKCEYFLGKVKVPIVFLSLN